MALGIGIGLPFQRRVGGSILDNAVAYWRASDYSGSGNLLDGSGNGHDGVFGASSAAPIFLPHTGTQYAYFPGSTGNNVSIGGLSNSTTYDYTVTYLDDSTADGEATTDGSGNLVLGNDQTNFDEKSVKAITVVPDGGGAEVAGADFTSITAPFASFTGSQSLTWTINRSSTGYKLSVVDRPLILFGGGQEIVVPDDADFDFASDESLTVVTAFRAYDFSSTQTIMAHKLSTGSGNAGWVLIWGGGNLNVAVADGSAQTVSPTSTPTAGTAHGYALRRDVPNDDLEAVLDGSEDTTTTDTTTSSLATSDDVFIGQYGTSGGRNLSAEFFGAAIFRSVLTDEEVSAAGTLLGA